MDESIGHTFVSAASTGWEPGHFDAELALDGKAFRPERHDVCGFGPSRIRLGRRKPAHMDRRGLGPLLERVRAQLRAARQGQLLRLAAEKWDAIPDRRARFRQCPQRTGA